MLTRRRRNGEPTQPQATPMEYLGQNQAATIERLQEAGEELARKLIDALDLADDLKDELQDEIARRELAEKQRDTILKRMGWFLGGVTIHLPEGTDDD